MAIFFRRQIQEFVGLDDQARKSIEKEFKVCRENGFVFFEIHAIFGRGVSLLRQGEIDEARKQFDIGLTMLKATGGNLSMDHPYRNISEAFLLAGLADDASQWINRGFDLVKRHHARMESEFWRLHGELALDNGDEKSAEESFLQAVDVARQRQAKSWELRAVMSLARFRQTQGRPKEGGQMLREVYSGFEEGFDTSDLIAAKSLLDELSAEA